MKIRWIKLALVIVLVLMLPLQVLAAGLCLPSFYSETYYAQLPRLYDRLYQTEGPKLILIGGSNIAFGVDTRLLEDQLRQLGYGYTVCPFGLYGAVGVSAMLELSKDALSEGDLVVIAIEPTSESMSDYFGAAAFWKCCESAPEMLTRLDRRQMSAMAGAYVPYLQERCAIYASQTAPAAEGAYTKAAFDGDCNMTFLRAGNAMPLGYDTAVSVSLEQIQIQPELCRQINGYCDLACSAGAQVVLSFSPVNRACVTDPDQGQSFFELCNRSFFCPVISDPRRYIMDPEWFYDSNFHLNTPGAQVRTQLLLEDLLTWFGDSRPLCFPQPDKPESIARLEEQEADSTLFSFTRLGSGWLVSGLRPEGLTQTSLTVPSSYEGSPVVGLTQTALNGASMLEELILPGSVESLPDDVFSGCPNLRRLILQHTDHICSITPKTFAHADQVRILVPRQSYWMYRDGDGCEVNIWSEYLRRIIPYG